MILDWTLKNHDCQRNGLVRCFCRRCILTHDVLMVVDDCQKSFPYFDWDLTISYNYQWKRIVYFSFIHTLSKNLLLHTLLILFAESVFKFKDKFVKSQGKTRSNQPKCCLLSINKSGWPNATNCNITTSLYRPYFISILNMKCCNDKQFGSTQGVYNSQLHISCIFFCIQYQ